MDNGKSEEYPQQPFPENALTEVEIVQENIQGVLKERFEITGITLNSPLIHVCDFAFWVEKTPDGYQLLISIVDVASSITADSTPILDQEARKRAFTHHTLEKVFVPLFPDALAEGSLSLLEGQACPTLTFSFSLDSTFQVGEPFIQQTFIRKSKRFTYEEADQEGANPTAPYASLFQDAYHIARSLWRARILRGAITTYDLKDGWVRTEDGVRILIDEDKRYQAYIIEQEFIIVANQALASYIAARNLPALYRNHASTTPPTKALYSSSIRGHKGLHLPVYIHALFPLRSYADLVNQRILLACLRGEPSPYTLEELEDLAHVLNDRESRIKAEKRFHFRDVYEEQVHKEREEVPLSLFDQDRFHSVIRIAVEKQQLSSEIEHEILTRLDQSRLRVNDLYALVFRFPNMGNEWQPIKEAIFAFLLDHPWDAAVLVNMGEQKGKWRVLGYEQPPSSGSFQPTVSLEYEGQMYTSSWHKVGKKDRAKQLAMVDILATIAGVVLPSS